MKEAIRVERSLARKGDVFTTNNCGVVKIVDYAHSREVVVQFLDTGTLRTVTYGNLKAGSIKDPYRRTVEGVGYFGEGEHKAKISGKMTTAYIVWTGMLARCYNQTSNSFSNYGGRGVTVNTCWHNFQCFAEWFNSYCVEGFCIDKDIMCRKLGKLEYGPDTCRFIPPYINTLLTDRRSLRGNHPLGVRRIKSTTDKVYVVQLTAYNKKVYLGCYSDQMEAFEVYKKYKQNHISVVAIESYRLKEISKEVMEVLCNWEISPFPT